MKNNNNLIAAGICIAIIVIIVALSASNIGWKIESKAVDSVKLSDVVVTKLEGEPYGAGPGTLIYTVTVTNTFIPRQYDLPYFNVCLYNTELKKSSIVDARWNVKGTKAQYDEWQNTLEVISGTKSADILIFQGIRYRPSSNVATPVKAAQAEEEVYNKMLLFLQEKDSKYNYRDCYNLQEEDFAAAITIPIIK